MLMYHSLVLNKYEKRQPSVLFLPSVNGTMSSCYLRTKTDVGGENIIFFIQAMIRYRYEKVLLALWCVCLSLAGLFWC